MIVTITLNPAVDRLYELEGFSIGNVFRADKVISRAGGKGINVAKVCAELGEKVKVLGFLGGSNGQFIRGSIGTYGIIDSFVDIEGDTRASINIIDRGNQTTTEILEKGPQISPGEVTDFMDVYRALIDEARVVVLSGSLPQGIDSRIYGTLIHMARQKDKKVILDTSNEALKEGIDHIPSAIKPNLEELRQITGKELKDDTSIIDAAVTLHKRGIELVCITLGGEGAIAVYDDHIYKLEATRLNVVNTVGCGDSFVAGIAVGYIRGLKLQDILKLAMACGMSNTQFSEPGRVKRELVERYKDEVSILKI